MGEGSEGMKRKGEIKTQTRKERIYTHTPSSEVSPPPPLPHCCPRRSREEDPAVLRACTTYVHTDSIQQDLTNPNHSIQNLKLFFTILSVSAGPKLFVLVDTSTYT